MTARPSYRSGLFLLEPRILQSDRDNAPGPDITAHVADASVDADIDRAGPKGRLQLATTNPDLVPVNTWIAPYQRVVPETGDIIDAQMGLYQLGEPEITYDGTGHATASNSGEDVIALLDRAVLSDAQVTNRNIDIMGEVRRSIHIATMARYGRNQFPYTLQRPTVDWGQTGSDSSGWTGTDDLSTDRGRRPRGDYSWRVTFAPGSPAGAYRYLHVSSVPIPSGAHRLYASHYRHVTHGFLRTSFELRFKDNSGTTVAQLGGISTADSPEAVISWLSRIDVGDVPPDATSLQVLAFVQTTQAITSGMGLVQAHLGGFEYGDALGEPLRRDALPPSFQRSATTAISHPAGTRWLTRINDLLAAIGYHALHATLDGQVTTRPLRDPRTDTPSRVYSFGEDSRLVDNVRVRRATGNIYNVIVAVKEDHQAGTALVAEARNDDPDHPWSTVNRGPISPTEPMTVSDVVDQAALDALASDKLARSSMQEELSIAVLPDPTMTAHDVIEVTGTDGAAAGRWSVESIAWGLTADDPLVRIGARRTITGKDL